MGPDGNTDLAGYELIPEEQVAEVLKSVDLPPEVQETVEARLERRTAALNQRFPHGHQRVKGPEEVRRRRARQQRVKNPRAGKTALVKTALSYSSRSSFAARSVRVHSPSPGRQDGLSTVQNAFRRLDSCPQYRAGQSYLRLSPSTPTPLMSPVSRGTIPSTKFPYTNIRPLSHHHRPGNAFSFNHGPFLPPPRQIHILRRQLSCLRRRVPMRHENPLPKRNQNSPTTRRA